MHLSQNVKKTVSSKTSCVLAVKRLRAPNFGSYLALDIKIVNTDVHFDGLCMTYGYLCEHEANCVCVCEGGGYSKITL